MSCAKCLCASSFVLRPSTYPKAPLPLLLMPPLFSPSPFIVLVCLLCFLALRKLRKLCAFYYATLHAVTPPKLHFHFRLHTSTLFHFRKHFANIFVGSSVSTTKMSSSVLLGENCELLHGRTYVCMLLCCVCFL